MKVLYEIYCDSKSIMRDVLEKLPRCIVRAPGETDAEFMKRRDVFQQEFRSSNEDK